MKVWNIYMLWLCRWTCNMDLLYVEYVGMDIIYDEYSVMMTICKVISYS